MRFEDLPKDVHRLPLTDPELITGVGDLIMRSYDRRRSTAGIMICDDAGRGISPVVTEDIPRGEIGASMGRILEGVGEEFGAGSGIDGVVLFLGGEDAPQARDLSTAEEVRERAEALGWRFQGAAFAGPDEVVTLLVGR